MFGKFALLALAGVIAAPAAAAVCGGVEGPGKVRVTVEAHGVRDARGQVAFTVYPDVRKQFLARRGKIGRLRVTAVAGTTSTCFWLAPGFYAFTIYHDANQDRDFNRTLFRPKEGFGSSNDAPATLGIPKFERVRIAVNAAASTVRIRMRYP